MAPDPRILVLREAELVDDLGHARELILLRDAFGETEARGGEEGFFYC